ncbi:MAG: hypothetical protein DSM106950_11400 [Stigonema ocellatum SAG 48.90 = DSM 106950]|nr:hypothetical protein [Stigonema ocellatum SAG 48.90 = DSM 106950]
MTQLQAIAQDSLTTAQEELNVYLEAQALVSTSASSFEALEGATQNILHHAQFLAQQKEVLSRSEYRKLLNLHGWKGEEKKYLKVANAFKEFSPEKLASIEPATIFRLANNPNKYKPVIDELQKLTEINQATVRELIATVCPPPEPKEEALSIWRRTKDGRRYCQIPPIHEDNQQTGTTLQRMIDESGLTAQRIVAEAIALRSAYLEGRLVFVEPAPVETTEQPVCDDVLEIVTSSATQHDETNDIDWTDTISVLSTEEDSEELEELEEWDGWTFEPEPEKEVDDDLTVVQASEWALTSVERCSVPYKFRSTIHTVDDSPCLKARGFFKKFCHIS